MRYNLADVLDLVQRLEPTFGPTELASKKGEEIHIWKAEKQYQVRCVVHANLTAITETHVDSILAYFRVICSTLR